MVSMSIRVPDEIHAQLNRLSKLTGRSKTYYVQKAISEKIDDLELLYLAQQRAENVRSSQSKTYSLDEVFDGLSD
ncbi:MAG: DUF6290 family protein [Treponema sp.]|nr:DUF6290 family protein [Treponema sp.]